MKRSIAFVALLAFAVNSFSQNQMTPELLWSLGRVSGLGVSKDKQWVLYSVSTPDINENKSKRKVFAVPKNGGEAIVINNPDSLLFNDRISPDGKYIISAVDVKLKKIEGKELYPELSKSNVQVYDQLNYRHWDTWEDGAYSHVVVATLKDGKAGEAKDIMPGELYDCPQKPFGGDEDFIWSPDSKKIIYVTKKKYGTAYAVSTNTDLYEYNIETGQTKNLTAGMMGYDINPAYNQKGELAWLSMKREGFESDKQDIVVSNGISKLNLTASRDDIHVEGFKWSEDNKTIFFWAPINGTLQLFEVNYPGLTKMAPVVRQITKGDFDVTGIVAQLGNKLIVSRTDMNHAAELYSVNASDGEMKQLTHVNDAVYANLGMSKTERRFVQTTDGKNMLVWIIYPPGFDPNKKYPVLLYCQGGPQSPLTQFYSFRWNFQLMAANGYIIVAPNRRGMPGHGTKWNEQISKDHGGQVMRDYLSAIDNVSKEKFVDKAKVGCVGPSYGGYSVYMLAGMHNNRFKSFISHDGIFDFRSMYGTTEELWFVNWDYGGSYWDKNNAAAQKSYQQFSPSNFVDKWNTPMLIFQGGKDYRVPTGQALQAFQALQLKGIKSRLVYLPDENHWVLSAQNAQVWQREFFKWLKETL
jgi:dipeptidyl aminopeptidase/acylaminoacyl peptidase